MDGDFQPADVLKHLSAERTRRYLLHAQHDPHRALTQYEHIFHFQSSLWEPFGHFEVVLRTAIAIQLTEKWGGEWYTSQHVMCLLNERHQKDLRIALARCEENNARAVEARRRKEAENFGIPVHRLPITRPTIEPGHVVAELSFSFWRYLLSRAYDRDLWVPVLHRAFPQLRPAFGRADRETLYLAIERVNHDRNRIAHHERIKRSPADLTRDLIAVTKSIDPPTAQWLATRIPSLSGD